MHTVLIVDDEPWVAYGIKAIGGMGKFWLHRNRRSVQRIVGSGDNYGEEAGRRPLGYPHAGIGRD